MSKPGADPSSGISSGDAWDGPSGIRHVGGAKLNQALVRNVRTYTAMLREKAQAATTEDSRLTRLPSGKRAGHAEPPVYEEVRVFTGKPFEKDWRSEDFRCAH